MTNKQQKSKVAKGLCKSCTQTCSDGFGPQLKSKKKKNEESKGTNNWKRNGWFACRQSTAISTYGRCLRGSRGGCCAPYTGCKLRERKADMYYKESRKRAGWPWILDNIWFTSQYLRIYNVMLFQTLMIFLLYWHERSKLLRNILANPLFYVMKENEDWECQAPKWQTLYKNNKSLNQRCH